MTLHFGCPNPHVPVRTSEDVAVMRKELNDLHDGEIIGIEHRRNVRSSPDYGTWCECQGTELILKVLITSKPDRPVVELCFRDVIEWKVGGQEFVGFIVSPENPVRFTGEMAPALNLQHGETEPTRVVAGEMYWRIVEQPGLHQNRGGLETGRWYFVPDMPWCIPTRTEKYEEIIQRFADRVPDGKFVFTVTEESAHGTEEEKDRLLAEENYRFTTATLPSFLEEKGMLPVDDRGQRWSDDEGFRWYELTQREMLTWVLGATHHGGGMLAIADERGLAYLFEVIENGCDNLVIYAREPLTMDELNGFYEQYGMKFYGGRSIWEELS